MPTPKRPWLRLARAKVMAKKAQDRPREMREGNFVAAGLEALRKRAVEGKPEK